MLLVQYRTFIKICMEKNMDRRQKKTREAIFNAFINLLSKKHYNQITVGEIIDKADVGRATFYAHFETKDFLLKEFCEELFCHIFDTAEECGEDHRHIFDCDAPSSLVLHLFSHIQRNDNHILDLLSCENNDLFLRYFKENLKMLIRNQPKIFENIKAKDLPDIYWINYVSSTFVETIKTWADNGMKEGPQDLTEYFLKMIN